MRRPTRNKLLIDAFVFALVFCLTARPVLNAADPEVSASRRPASLAESLFDYASNLGRALHERPPEGRSAADYRAALDAYGQVIRLNTDNYYSAESLARRAELEREMADATGDSALYQQAIESYRRVITAHPQSAFVGDALVSIAQIYEESLQDLDGAANAYRELVRYFPDSVLAREARAVLARFESQLGHRPLDVTVSAERIRAANLSDEPVGAPRLTNVRSFGGPDYARVVIDLSDQTQYVERRAGNNRLSIQLSKALVSSSLLGRRFIVGESSLLKRIRVYEGDAALPDEAMKGANGPRPGAAPGVQVEIEVGSLADYSMFRLAEPERIVIDIHAAVAAAKSGARAATPREIAPGAVQANGRSFAAPASGPSGAEANDARSKQGRPSAADKNAILALPEISDPILPMGPADSRGPANSPAPAANALAARVEAKAAESVIKRIVIDPGHGGHDTGTISSNGMREKDLVLDVARRLRAYIKHNYPDVEVIMTRDSDRFIALEERTAIANSRRADLFISVHANASPSRAASGVETYFLSPDRAPSEDMQTAARENARIATEKAQPVVASVTVSNRVAESRELARYIQAGLVRGIGAASPRTAMNRGVKHAAFVVLLGASMPSVLAEVSFLSNPKDEALLQTAQFRERIAASLFAGLNAYLKKNRPAEQKAK
ncbi:MAG: N-acetylmuramoyl-L-alanine amidase [Blastocatellia bacterium]